MSVCLSVPELLPQFWGENRQTFCGTSWGPSRCPKVGVSFHKYLNTMILSVDTNEAAPDPDVRSERHFFSFTSRVFVTLYIVML